MVLKGPELNKKDHILQILLKIQTLLALAALTAGIMLPCFRIVPRMGRYTWVVKILNRNAVESHSFSIVSSIGTLFEEKEIFIAVVILMFSVVFPYLKLAVLWQGVMDVSGHRRRVRKWVNYAAKIGKYSMLDVLVMALLLLCIKGLPGDSAVSLQFGAYLFCISILLTLGIPWQLYICARHQGASLD